MIDEKKLIEHLQRAVSGSDNSNFTNGLLSAIDIVNMQPKIGEGIVAEKNKMERLTTRGLYGKREMVCRFENCNTLAEHCPHINEDNCLCLQSVLKRLGEYEDMEEQGRLVKLPLKEGTPIYCNGEIFAPHCKGQVHKIENWHYSPAIIRKYFHGELDYEFCVEDFGKMFFLTREEAEQALEEMRKK